MTREQIDTIKSWQGFEEFTVNDVNFVYEFENLFTEKKCTISILMEAVKRGELEIVDNLIKAGSDVNYVSETTNLTPLLSIEDETSNKIEICQILINAGADINFLSITDKDLLDAFDGALGNEPTFTSALSNACGFENYELVRLLVDFGAKVNDKSEPISKINLESKDSIKIIDFLIANGADINSSYGELLKTAVRESKISLIEKLVSLGSQVDVRKENGFSGGKTALMLLLDGEANLLNKKQEENAFFELWKNIESINIQDNEGKSLLFYAINNDLGNDDFFLKIFDSVLTHPDLNINLTDNNGNTALNYLLIKINQELKEYNTIQIDDYDLYKIRMLVIGRTNIGLANKDTLSPKNQFIGNLKENLKAPLELINEEDILGYTPLLNAVLDNDIQKVKWLIKNGAIVDKKCCANGQYEDYRIPKPRYTKEKGITALMLADSIEMIKILVENGAYIDSQDYENNSVLIHYSSRLWFEGVQFLLRNGANPNIKNKKYETALSMVMKYKNGKYERRFELINLLKKVTKVKISDKILYNVNLVKSYFV